jgi:hypothetical protein
VAFRGNEGHLRRLALQLAAQLPDTLDDSLYVLDCARELMQHLAQESPRRSAVVIRLSSDRPERVAEAGANEPEGLIALPDKASQA